MNRRLSLVVTVSFMLFGCTPVPFLTTPTHSTAPLPSETSPHADLAALGSAAPGTPTIQPSPYSTATPMMTSTPTTVSTVYQSAFGIDYANPEQYLKQGEQTEIFDPLALDPLRIQAEGIDHFAHIYRWLHSEFTNYSARGATIGVATVDQLLDDRQLDGCHDYGLVFSAVVRELGYPAVMVDSCSIAWIEQFQMGEADSHIGHVFVEVYLDGEWMLIDPTNGWYVEDGYDPANPIIPLQGAIAGSSNEIYGFYIDLKGIDTWSYGIHSLSELTQAMDDLADTIDLQKIIYPDYRFEHFGW